MIKLLLIDDSLTVKKYVSQIINTIENINLITASTAKEGRDLLVRDDPDVIILDIELPDINGLVFLKKIMKYKPKPVIIFSSHLKDKNMVEQAFSFGASDIIIKERKTRNQFRDEIQYKVTSLYKNFYRKRNVETYHNFKNKIIFIGSSTGGTIALRKLLIDFPINFPPVVIIQHMPENFTNSFANSLNEICKMKVQEGKNMQKLEKGNIYIAPGGIHTVLKKINNDYYIKLINKEPVYHQKPSVEVGFNSVIKESRDFIGIMLTGMGKDGAKAMSKMKLNGSYNIVQDEKSSIVFGMPKEAIEHGAANEIQPLDKIAQRLINILKI